MDCGGAGDKGKRQTKGGRGSEGGDLIARGGGDESRSNSVRLGEFLRPTGEQGVEPLNFPIHRAGMFAREQGFQIRRHGVQFSETFAVLFHKLLRFFHSLS